MRASKARDRAQDRESRVTGAGPHTDSRKEQEEERFTTLFHHLSIDLFRDGAFFALKRDAAPGVDGLTWRTVRGRS